MSTIKVAPHEPKTRDSGIQSGDLVLFRLPKGDFRSIKVEKDTCVCRSKKITDFVLKSSTGMLLSENSVPF
jgi:hypothetical protein